MFNENSLSVLPSFDSDFDESPTNTLTEVDMHDVEGEHGDEDGTTIVDSEDSEEDVEDEAEDSISAQTIEGLESIALSFIMQLEEALSDVISREKRADCAGTASKSQNSKQKKKIALELADRSRKSSMAGSSSTRFVQFPRNIKGPSAKPLAQLLQVVDVAHGAIINNCSATKRDIYYRDVSLFGTQSTVNGLVDDIAATLDVGRGNLNIRASPKGLFCGSGLTIHFHEGGSAGGLDTEASIIPVAEDVARFEMNSDIAWVLIVEKEAVFQTLCAAGLTSHASLPGPGLLITGKGYPDIATRQIVKTFSDNLPEDIPILALVDADAFGIDIVSVYKLGSACMKHQNSTLAAERVEWVGVSCACALSLGVDRAALLPITIHDQRKALSMLRSRPDMPLTWRQELMRMLHTRRKAEIEVLLSLPTLQKTDTLGNNQDAQSAPLTAKGRTSNPLVRYTIDSLNCILATQKMNLGLAL